MRYIKTPANLNERIAFDLGFQKYKYGNDGYAWVYPKDWISGGSPAFNIPDFVGMAKKWRDLCYVEFINGFATCHNP